MRRVVLLLIVLGLAFAPAPLPKDMNKRDLSNMQGEWIQVSEENAPFGVTDPRRRLVIVGSKATLHPGGDITIGAIIKLDAERLPKTLEFRFPEAIPEQGLMWRSYRLDGDTLELCYDPGDWLKPPRKISGKEDGLILETYRRKKR